MPWTLSFAQDTEIIGVGTATATFTDETGRVVASHSGRIDERDGATIDRLIDEALARYAERVQIDSSIPPLLAKIQAVLDAKTK